MWFFFIYLNRIIIENQNLKLMKTVQPFFSFLMMVLFFNVTNLSSQTHSVAEEGNTWHVLRDAANPVFFTEIYRVEGDTIIAEETWQIISCAIEPEDIDNETWPTKFYLLEKEGMLYFTLPDELTPRLYFDFTAEVLEEVELFSPFLNSSFQVTIESIETIEIEGISYHQFIIQKPIGEEDYVTEIWIEGIGSLNGIFYGNSDPNITGIQFDLTCFSQHSEVVYPEGFEGNCYQTNVSTQDLQFSHQVRIHPNPFRNFIYVSQNEKRILSAALVDSNGKTVLEEKQSGTSGELMLQTGHLSAGLYMLKVITDEGQVVRKVIKH
ncbi:MAG: T9SS C-terminal target domain-containing protein [Bacteroidetes bacterium]|nr:MAG: T9SS C-terminal target domain-containing protein [Bacteroidota bacterium]